MRDISYGTGALDLRVAGAGVWPGTAGDTGRQLGSGSDQLRPDSEARRGDSEPGKLGLGGQPATPPGRATRLSHPAVLTAQPVRRAVSTAAVRTGSRDLEVRRGDPGPGKRGLGGQPVTPPGRATRPRLRPRRSGERSALPRSGQDRGSAHCEAEPWTGAMAARRTAGHLSPAGLRLATITALTVAVRRGWRSRLSRA